MADGEEKPGDGNQDANAPGKVKTTEAPKPKVSPAFLAPAAGFLVESGGAATAGAATAGAGTAGAGTAAVAGGTFLGITPVGWVIIGGVVVAGGGYAAYRWYNRKKEPEAKADPDGA